MILDTLLNVLYLAIGYAAGSLPFGYWLAKRWGYGDIREIGSGNIGANNVLRTGDYKLAGLVLFLDALKGFVPALIGGPWGALGAVIGHIFSWQMKFKGGKGVATSLGVMLAIDPSIAIALVITWLVMAGLFRYASLAAISAAVLAPLFAAAFADLPEIVLSAFLMVLIIYAHRMNIKRLLAGIEPQIGDRN